MKRRGEEFGDRVKLWVTFNEPWTFTWLASGWGKAPSIPERTQTQQQERAKQQPQQPQQQQQQQTTKAPSIPEYKNMSHWPYIAAHNVPNLNYLKQTYITLA